MNFRYIVLPFLLLVSSFPRIANALILIPDNSINPAYDIVILNEEIDQKTSDNTILKIHELQSVDKDKPIYMLIDSPGGEVIEGARIIDAMVASNRPIYTVAMGETASMAAIIHSYGEKRYMLPNAILMYHTISGSYSGDIVRIQSRLRMAEGLQDRYAKHICSVTNVTMDELNHKMMDEWWVNSDEAQKRKFVDDLIISTAFYIPKEEKPKETATWFPWLPQK